jgi:N-methylhydantoinase B/oxoprolinase/acetone carboxylase alpha subunit
MLSGGGGGFGNPFKRDPLKVAEDVREGYVSRAAAEKYIWSCPE